MAKGSKVGQLDRAYQYVKNQLPRMGFFSTLDELIANAPFEKAPIEEWRNYLKAGRILEREGVRFPLKQEEIDYSGLYDQFLEMGSSPIPKGELRNTIQRKRPDLALRVGVLPPEQASSTVPYRDIMMRARVRRFPEETQLGPGFGGVQGEDWRNPPVVTGEEYREWSHRHEPGGYEESTTRSTDFGPYETHFGPDIISHSRTTTQPTADKRLLRLIEEIQSDRHQAAAEKWTQSQSSHEADRDFFQGRRGYRTPSEEMELRELQKRVDHFNAQNVGAIERSLSDSARSGNDPVPVPPKPGEAEARQRLMELKQKVPDAPFKDPADYGTLEMKQQLLNAVGEDADYLGLIRGQDVSKRFSQKPDEAKGTSHIYDKVYRSQLEKLARQYGTTVEDVATNLRSSVDVATPTMRELDTENIFDFMDHIQSHIEDLGPNDPPEISGLTDSLIEELEEITQMTVSAKAAREDLRKARKLVNQGKYDTEEFNEAWEYLKDNLKEMHDEYREILTVRDEASPEVKSFPSMKLTPEIREKIKKAGVPIWALTGASLAGLGANEEVEGFAEGGKVGSLERLRELAREFAGQDEGGEERNARFLSGLASQLYGKNELSGEPEFMGGDLASYFVPQNILSSYRRNISKTPEIQSYGPGLIDELRAMMIGTKKAEKAEERLEEMRSRIRERMELEEARGFEENFDESLGIMAGQLPVPLMSVRTAAKNLTPKSALKGLMKNLPEWFTPIVEPTPASYLGGALVGGGIGTLADPDEEVIEKAKGGVVEATRSLDKMLETLRVRMQRLETGMPQLPSLSDNALPNVGSEPVMKAKGGKVKTLLELREMLTRNLESPNVEGTGRELSVPEAPTQALVPSKPDHPTPESIRRMVEETPAVPSAPLQASRREVLQGLAGMLSPVDIPVSATGVANTIAKQAMKAPTRHHLWGTDQARQDLEDLIFARENEDYADAIGGLEEIFAKYPEHRSGIKGTMLEIQRYLDKHGDDIWDDDEIEKGLLELDRVREEKISNLAKELGFKPNPHSEDIFGGEAESYEWPEEEGLRHDLFIPEDARLVSKPDFTSNSPHLERAIGILNTSDPNDARKYLDGLYENSEISAKEYESLLVELEEIIEEEIDGAIDND